jgi:hypothetical protein
MIGKFVAKLTSGKKESYSLEEEQLLARSRAEMAKYCFYYGTKVTHILHKDFGVGIISAFKYFKDGQIELVGVYWTKDRVDYLKKEKFYAPYILKPVAKLLDFKIYIRTKTG